MDLKISGPSLGASAAQAARGLGCGAQEMGAYWAGAGH